MKKFLSLFLAVFMVVSIAACNSSSSTDSTTTVKTADTTKAEESKSDTDSSKEGETKAAGSAEGSLAGIEPMEDADDPITYSVFIRDPSMAPSEDNPVIAEITALTGVTLKYEFLVGDLDQKLGVMIAGGDYPDAIFAGNAASKLIEAGAFIPLEDKLPEYPNLHKLYKDCYDVITAEDGHIYNMEIYNVSDTELIYNNGGSGFYIQKAVLEEFDYPIPKTIDEYFTLIEDYVEKYPEIDGVKTIGFEVLSDGWRNFCLVNPPQHLLGAGNDGALFVDTDSLETSFYQTSDTAYEYYKKLNEMYHKGLIEPETLTQNYDQYISRVSTGAVLGFFDQYWNFQSADNVLRDDGKFDRTYISVPIANKNTQDGYLDAPSLRALTGVNGIGITENCKDPDRLLRFYDWLLQREVQEYLHWGTEGVDWNYTEDGGKVLTPERRAITWDVAKNRDLTGYTLQNYAPKWEGFYEDGMPCRPADSADEYLAGLSEYDIDFLGEYGFKYPAEMLSDPVERLDYYPIWSMTLEDGSPAAVSSTKISDTTAKYYPRLILANDDAEYDSIWEDFVSEFESIDLDSYQTEIDRQISEKMK